MFSKFLVVVIVNNRIVLGKQFYSNIFALAENNFFISIIFSFFCFIYPIADGSMDGILRLPVHNPIQSIN